MKTSNQFLSIPFELLCSNKLTSNEKIIVSYVLGWENNSNDCNASNKYILNRLGLTRNQLNLAITNLNKLPFFESKRTSRDNSGKWINRKIMNVNVELLTQYLSESETIIPTQPEAKKEPIITEEIKQPIMEENKIEEQNEKPKATPEQIEKWKKDRERIHENLTRGPKEMLKKFGNIPTDNDTKEIDL